MYYLLTFHQRRMKDSNKQLNYWNEYNNAIKLNNLLIFILFSFLFLIICRGQILLVYHMQSNLFSYVPNSFVSPLVLKRNSLFEKFPRLCHNFLLITYRWHQILTQLENLHAVVNYSFIRIYDSFIMMCSVSYVLTSLLSHFYGNWGW